MSETPPFGSRKCPHCKGTGINPWGGSCGCDDGWILPKEQPDPEGGEKAKQEGMGRADGAAPPEWKVYAYQVLKRLCKRVPDMTTDDVFFAIQDEGYPPDPPEPRAFGPLMVRAASDGLITQTDEFRKSDRKKAHRRPKQVWRVI